MTVSRFEGDFPFVIFFYPYQIVGAGEVQLGKLFGLF